MKTLFKSLAVIGGTTFLLAHVHHVLAIDATDTSQPEQSSSIIASSKESEQVVQPPTQATAPPVIELPKPMATTRAGFTQVGTVAALKTALENGESVQLTADITLSNNSERIQLGKTNPQDITIDGADPLTGQHHRLDVVDSSATAASIRLHFGSNMGGTTIKLTNLKITNNNYYGICHPALDSYSRGSTLLLDNVDYTSTAQALHLMYGVVAFSGNNTITQQDSAYSQEFAETGRLDFRGGTTTINHTGRLSYGLLRIEQMPTDGIAAGLQVSGGAKVNITTNNAIFPTVGLGITQIDIESKGAGSSLTLNAGGHIFDVTGTVGSKTVASDGGSINVTKGTNFYQNGTTNRLISATNDGHINLQLAETLYNLAQTNSPMSATQNSSIDVKTTGVTFDASQTKSPVTADQNSTINLASDSNVFDASSVQDSPISATNGSQINLNAGKDLFAYIYSPTSGNPLMQLTADSTSKMGLVAKDAFIRNAQASGLKFDIGGQLSATFGQYFANSSDRPFFHDFRDNSTVDLTINGAQSAANGLIPLGSTGSYMKIGDHSKVTINNQTTTS
ncbi:hypothetical protein EFM09_01535 [Latilactobacillus curvatus]|uniref:Uncharacterized protein n=3 Tax=Latilactobacillus curvatus TaxID=28038 RepID=A0A385AF48_LATCU|nr:pectate lyase-like adhesive domain-containing protein [Latilactobacillus curvatus]AXN36251.1 hypothetical protein DT351_07655 [Latilactobacillus curvatus]MCT1215261.1 hypothetical protein [Latilactobacillus curvatus]MCT3531911.1 hypothetical protein [Latilactobacillus curvatus]MCW8779426.1 hypothetical protein [Latilactobacillus curvatus]UTC10210.1 hypothetical protein A4W79_02730 [Latilactobacillus curvatus]